MTTTQDRRRSFQQAIAASPNDPAPRLVYADWLEEHGHVTEAEEQRSQANLTADPYDAEARAGYAAWLADHGREADSNWQYWLVHLLKGRYDHQAVCTRQGPLERAGSEFDLEPGEAPAGWSERASDLFAIHGDVLFLVLDDGPPSSHGLRPEGEPLAKPGPSSPVLYVDGSNNQVHRIGGADAIEETSLCPFCGCDGDSSLPDAGECPHLVTEMTEWPENDAGTNGGAFGAIADDTLGPLAEAAREWLAKGATARRLRSLPDRLRPVVEAVAEEAEASDEPEGEEFDEEGEPEVNESKAAFADYVCAVFWEVAERGRINSFEAEDRWGTACLLLWSPDAAATARDMARLVAGDAGGLKEVGRSRTGTKGRRSRK